MLEKIILTLNECQKELTQTLVDGGSDLSSDNKIRGEINGLEKAKALIYQVFEETNNHDISIEEDSDE